LPNNIQVDSKQKTTQYNGGVTFGYPLLLTQKSQINLTSGFDYTDRQDDYALQARLQGKTYSLDSVNQHARYPALEVGINGAHQFTTASISGRLNVRQGIDAMGADIVSAPKPDINFTLTKSYLDAAWLFADKWRLSTSWEETGQITRCQSPNALASVPSALAVDIRTVKQAVITATAGR
jgi:hemolysin activation/secretion protein